MNIFIFIVMLIFYFLTTNTIQVNTLHIIIIQYISCIFCLGYCSFKHTSYVFTQCIICISDPQKSIVFMTSPSSNCNVIRLSPRLCNLSYNYLNYLCRDILQIIKRHTLLSRYYFNNFQAILSVLIWNHEYFFLNLIIHKKMC